MQHFKISLYFTSPDLTDLLSFLFSFRLDDTLHDSILDEIDKILILDIAFT